MKQISERKQKIYNYIILVFHHQFYENSLKTFAVDHIKVEFISERKFC